MPTPLDTPEPRDVLRGHQLDRLHAACTCTHPLPGIGTMAALADHQLGVLQASGLAVVSVYGTAGVVEASAAVVGAFRVAGTVTVHAENKAHAHALRGALLRLVERVEAIGK